MPFYKVNAYGPNQLSHRHPFHGFGQAPQGMVTGAAAIASVVKAGEGGHYMQEGRDPFDFDYRMIDRRYYSTVQGYGAYGLTTDEAWDTAKVPILKGAITGIVGYSYARAVGVDNKKATKLAVVMGVVHIGIGIITSMLEKAQQQESQTTQPPAPTTPTTNY